MNALNEIVAKFQEFNRRDAFYAWLALLITQFALIAIFPSNWILIVVVSVIGWFGAIFYLQVFMPRGRARVDR